MKVLFYDVLQESDAPSRLLSPSLAERNQYTSPVEINLNNPAPINSIGIGYVSAENFTIYNGGNALTNNFEVIIGGGNASSNFAFIINGNGANGMSGNYLEIDIISVLGSTETTTRVGFDLKGSGLYTLPHYPLPVLVKKLIVYPNSIYLGRLAAGLGIQLGTSRAKEPAILSTAQPRKTLSGQVIPGTGGYNYKQISLDVRYKIDGPAIIEIEKGFREQIGRGYPFFVCFDDEERRLYFLPRLYCTDNNPLSFESSINFYLFSRKFVFEECF